MKKNAAMMLSLLTFFSPPVFPEPDFSQILIPKKIFVGDTAELRFSFRSSLELFEDSPESDEKFLSVEKLPYDADGEDLTVLRLALQRNGPFYTVVFTFIPWKTDAVDIPPFDLFSVMGKTSTVPLLIDPEPFEVSSILSRLSEDSPRPPLGPLLVPGTIYFVWALIFAAVLVLALSVALLARRKKICDFIKRTALLSSYAKNSRRALRELKRLEVKSENFSDAEFSLLYQKIFRKYFKGRLGSSFDSVSTNELSKAFHDATGGFMGGERESKMEEMCGIFHRTDYIRYASGSLESKKLPSRDFAAAFQDGERKSIVQSGRDFVAVWESDRYTSSADEKKSVLQSDLQAEARPVKDGSSMNVRMGVSDFSDGGRDA